jgi:hydrogenase maturation protein HypF
MRAEGLKEARRLHVGGIVQGVGFRPFVYRIARQHGVTGWVLNGENGVEIHAEGNAAALDDFERALLNRSPPASRISEFHAQRTARAGFETFEIRTSRHERVPTVRVSPDLPVCDACLSELFDASNRRYRYPYINCTNCGPRYSIIQALPYDRQRTTMRDWKMCSHCSAEYDDPADRRFHAQPLSCPQCGPAYVLESDDQTWRADAAIANAAQLLAAGAIVAVKGIGGYHLACDARRPASVQALRTRKYRKERPFAVMVRDLETASRIVELDQRVRQLLQSQARPIVLAPARVQLEGLAPDNRDLGVMLAYTPMHYLLFGSGAPDVLVMTSANRSSEPIAYRDDDARESLKGIADAFLVGERRIARRIDDSVVRPGMVMRTSRGYAPQAVATLPITRPMLAVGADLKNAVALVVRGQVFVSHHIGDLEHYEALRAFKDTISDLTSLYEVAVNDMMVVHDAHPQYASSAYAMQMGGEKIAVQHHRAHIASVLAEHHSFDETVLGFAFDGTGYGEDGTIWGGEIFAGALRGGLRRVGHLRPARLAGGDAAAHYPVQAAAGYLEDFSVDFTAPPFNFPQRYRDAKELLRKNVRVFGTTSMGRLFDTVAAVLGFTREITFEAQAAMWVEHLARASGPAQAYPFPFKDGQLDYRPLLERLIHDRIVGRDIRQIARAFHEALARGILAACSEFGQQRIVISGGVFQNALLTQTLSDALGERLWMNRVTPPNDGGICVGQAAIAALSL